MAFHIYKRFFGKTTGEPVVSWSEGQGLCATDRCTEFLFYEHEETFYKTHEMSLLVVSTFLWWFDGN